MKNIKLELKNIGGFTDSISPFTFTSGLNVISGSNASGKTSILMALRAAVLPQVYLYDESQRGLLNRRAKHAYVKFVGDIKFSREFEVIEEQIKAINKPFVQNGDRVNNLSIILSDNQLLRYVNENQSFKDMFEEYSGSHYYSRLIDWLDNELNETKTTLDALGKELVNYERLTKETREIEQLVAKLEEELDALPKVEYDSVEDSAVRERIEQLDEEISTLNRDYRETQKRIRFLENGINEYAKKILDVTNKIKRFDEKYPNPGQTINDLSSELVSLDNSFENNKIELKSANVELKQKANVLNNWTDDEEKKGKCPICNESLTKKQLQNLSFELEEKYKKLQEFGKGLFLRRTEKKEELDRIERELYEKDDAIEQKEKFEIHLTSSFIREYATLLQQRIELPHQKGDFVDPSSQKIKDKKSSYFYIPLPTIEKELNLKKEERDEESKKLNEEARKRDEAIRKKTDQIASERTRLDIKKNEIENLGDVHKKLQNLEKIRNFQMASIRVTSKEADEVRNKIRNDFEKKIMEVYTNLGFKDFEKIYLNSDFRLIIERRNMGAQPVSELSGAERSTIGVVLILAAKELYENDFPFFAMDEVILNYDPDKMKRILEYVTQRVEFVLVTSLADETQAGIKILHSIQSL